MANRLFLYLLIFGANSLKAQNPIVYLSFDDWPLVKLDGGKLICTDYVNIFTDEFNSSIQFDKNWNKYMGNNPDCGLAHGSGSVFSETNVILDTAAITGGITGQVELYVTKTSTTGDIDCDSNVTNYITREYTGGVIQKSADQAFNLGRYKFRFKFPMQNKIWSAFWMFHNGIEIDMIDNGYSSNVNHNVFQNDLANQIFNSPCSPFFSECNFCPTPQGIDCYSSNATCAGITENHYNWDCMYLAEGFHELICEWTPYQISFSIDGYETGTVYRYYDLDKNPLKIACGDLIPEIVVKENPAFASRVKDTYMLPIIWTSTACNQNNSDTASCNQTGAVILDNFIVDERVYQVLSLLPEPLCYKLCNNENICINIKQYPLNFMYSKSNSLFNPLPPITVSSWNLTSPNAVITSSNDHSICIEYTGTSCSNPTSCQEKVCFEANYSSPGFPSGSIIKCLYPPQEPKFYSQCSSFIEASKENQNESKKCLCVDLGNNCDALVLLDNQPVPSSPTGGLICYDRANPCINMDVTIDNCGNTISYSSVFYQFQSTLPHFEWGSPVKLFDGTKSSINFIYSPIVSFCYLPSSVPMNIVSVESFSSNTTISITANCIQLSNIVRSTTVIVTIERCGVLITQEFVFVVPKHLYKVQPNPTTDYLNLIIENPVTITDSSETIINIFALPTSYEIINTMGLVVKQGSLSQVAPSSSINLTDQLQGIYTLFIYDDNIPESKIDFQILKQ